MLGPAAACYSAPAPWPNPAYTRSSMSSVRHRRVLNKIRRLAAGQEALTACYYAVKHCREVLAGENFRKINRMEPKTGNPGGILDDIDRAIGCLEEVGSLIDSFRVAPRTTLKY